MKPKHQRLLFIALSVAFLCTATLFAMQAFRQNIVYFYSPTDTMQKPPASGKIIRIGGLVKNGSLKQSPGQQVYFTITDQAHDIHVTYQGMLPNLFREGQGVVAEGTLQENGTFMAKRVLAKHDENYMPKEVVDALKKSGHWQEKYAR